MKWRRSSGSQTIADMRSLVLSRSFIALVTIAAATFFVKAASAQNEFTLKLGQEVDSNPLRISDGGSAARTATRLVVGVTRSDMVGERGAVDSDLHGLARQVFGLDNESAVGLAASARLRGQFTEATSLSVSTSTRVRVEPTRDCRDADAPRCSPNQDYASVRGELRARVAPRSIGVSGGPYAQSFAWGPVRDLSWVGGGALLALDARLMSGFTAALGVDLGWRRFHGPVARLGTNGGWYIDEDLERGDRLVSSWAATTYTRAGWHVQARYIVQHNRSNSTAKGYVRHIVEPSITGVPVADLLVRVSARIHRMRADTRGLQDASLNLDDEARDRLSVVLEQPLGARLAIELGHAYYVQAATSGDASDDPRARFSRHVAHLALAARLGARSR